MEAGEGIVSSKKLTCQWARSPPRQHLVVYAEGIEAAGEVQLSDGVVVALFVVASRPRDGEIVRRDGANQQLRIDAGEAAVRKPGRERPGVGQFEVEPGLDQRPRGLEVVAARIAEETARGNARDAVRDDGADHRQAGHPHRIAFLPFTYEVARDLLAGLPGQGERRVVAVQVRVIDVRARAFDFSGEPEVEAGVPAHGAGDVEQGGFLIVRPADHAQAAGEVVLRALGDDGDDSTDRRATIEDGRRTLEYFDPLDVRSRRWVDVGVIPVPHAVAHLVGREATDLHGEGLIGGRPRCADGRRRDRLQDVADAAHAAVEQVTLVQHLDRLRYLL